MCLQKKKRKNFYKLLHFTPVFLIWKLLDEGKVWNYKAMSWLPRMNWRLYAKNSKGKVVLGKPHFNSPSLLQQRRPPRSRLWPSTFTRSSCCHYGNIGHLKEENPGNCLGHCSVERGRKHYVFFPGRFNYVLYVMYRQAVLNILHYHNKMYNENDTNDNYDRIKILVVQSMNFGW